MPHIIAEPCIGTKDTSCVEVCPVDCIHPTKGDGDHAAASQLYIDPDTCIDCDACLPECPVEAIYSDMSIPEEYLPWLEINATAENYPIISVKQPALMGPGCSGPPE